MSDTHKNLVAALRGRTSRKVDNNTYARRLDSGAVVLRLHKTDIMTAEPDGSVVIRSGGWRTVTTKARLNDYLKDGLSISQARGIWYWHRRHSYTEAEGYQWEKLPAFSEGDVIGQRGALRSAAVAGSVAAALKLSREVNAYAKLCAAAVPLAMPGGGDCFYCQFTVAGTPSKLPAAGYVCAKPEAALPVTLGDASGSAEHLRSHMAEGYVVPSLVFHALKECGAGDLILSGAFGQWAGVAGLARGHVIRAVRRYLKRRLALAGN
jgi:hypothetical protein